MHWLPRRRRSGSILPPLDCVPCALLVGPCLTLPSSPSPFLLTAPLRPLLPLLRLQHTVPGEFLAQTPDIRRSLHRYQWHLPALATLAALRPCWALRALPLGAACRPRLIPVELAERPCRPRTHLQVGPFKQIKRMFDGKRWVATSLYLGSLVCTLVAVRRALLGAPPGLCGTVAWLEFAAGCQPPAHAPPSYCLVPVWMGALLAGKLLAVVWSKPCSCWPPSLQAIVFHSVILCLLCIIVQVRPRLGPN